MKGIRLGLVILLAFMPLTVLANSPQKYRVSFKISSELPDSSEKFKVYMNNAYGTEIQESPKTYKVDEVEKSIDLVFVSLVDVAKKFSVTLPAPGNIEDFQNDVIVEMSKDLKIMAKITSSLERPASVISTVVYHIELSGVD